MTDMGDAFVALVLFNGMFVSWLFYRLSKTASQMAGLVDYRPGAPAFRQDHRLAHPRVSQRHPDRAFFVVMGFFMLRFEPLLRRDEKK